MAENELEYFVGFAHRLADKSGTIIRAGFGGFKEVLEKSDSTPVTPVDREAEERSAGLEAEYPEHGIRRGTWLRTKARSSYGWSIRSYPGLPVFGTLIALNRHGVPALAACRRGAWTVAMYGKRLS